VELDTDRSRHTPYYGVLPPDEFNDMILKCYNRRDIWLFFYSDFKKRTEENALHSYIATDTRDQKQDFAVDTIDDRPKCLCAAE